MSNELRILFFLVLQSWPIVYLAWFIQSAVGDGKCSDLDSSAHLIAKVIIWTEVAALILMVLSTVFWYCCGSKTKTTDSIDARSISVTHHRAAAQGSISYSI